MNSAKKSNMLMQDATLNFPTTLYYLQAVLLGVLYRKPISLQEWFLGFAQEKSRGPGLSFGITHTNGKKLAEMARPPLPDLAYRYRCRCGQEVQAAVSIDPITHSIIARARCACGNEVMVFLGHLVQITCRACKAIQKF